MSQPPIVNLPPSDTEVIGRVAEEFLALRSQGQTRAAGSPAPSSMAREAVAICRREVVVLLRSSLIEGTDGARADIQTAFRPYLSAPGRRTRDIRGIDAPYARLMVAAWWPLLESLFPDNAWVGSALTKAAVTCLPVLSTSLLSADPSRDLALIRESCLAELDSFPISSATPSPTFGHTQVLRQALVAQARRSDELQRAGAGDLRLREELSNDAARRLRFLYAGIYIGLRVSEDAVDRLIQDLSGTAQPIWAKEIEEIRSSVTSIGNWIVDGLEDASGPGNQTTLHARLERLTACIICIAGYAAAIEFYDYLERDAPWTVVGEGLIIQPRLERITNNLDKVLEELQEDGRNFLELRQRAESFIDELLHDVRSFESGVLAGQQILSLAPFVSFVSVSLQLIGLAQRLGLLLGGAIQNAGPGLALASGGTITGIVHVGAADILVKVIGITTALAAAAQPPGQLPHELGKAGEQARGISGEKIGIDSITGTTKSGIRIPDRVDLSTLTLEEVKNVLKLSLTRQLTDFILFAQANGLKIVISVRKATKISGPLQDLVNQGIVHILRVL